MDAGRGESMEGGIMAWRREGNKVEGLKHGGRGASIDRDGSMDMM